MADKDDRPGGMLEISPALERDLDKAAQGKIPAPPIEAFMSDAALQEAQDATDAASAPVHAEDLTPISPVEAAARRTQHGESLPSMPTMRKVIPAPFRRPSVTGGSHGKRWQLVRAGQVARGDIIPDLGLVTGTEERVIRESVAGVGEVPVRTEIAVTGAGGLTRQFRLDAQVRVFRKA